MKKVEELQTDDFINSAATSSDVSLDQSTLVRVEVEKGSSTAALGFQVGREKLQVSVSAGLEHPFFVFGRGWASCSPELSMTKYSLACSQLSPGDVCISLAHAEHQKPSLVHAEHQKNSLVHAEHQNNTSVNQGLRLNQDGAHGPRSGNQGHQRSNTSQQSTSSYPSRLPPPIQTAKADT